MMRRGVLLAAADLSLMRRLARIVALVPMALFALAVATCITTAFALTAGVMTAIAGIASAAIARQMLARHVRAARAGFSRGLFTFAAGTPIGHGYRCADELLDVAQEGQLFAVAERDGDAVGAGARGAADAVHVGLRHVRQVEVDDVADAVDVDAAGGDVGGDQRRDLAAAERRQRALALALRFVAVDGVGRDAGA